MKITKLSDVTLIQETFNIQTSTNMACLSFVSAQKQNCKVFISAENSQCKAVACLPLTGQNNYKLALKVNGTVSNFQQILVTRGTPHFPSGMECQKHPSFHLDILTLQFYINGKIS